MGIGYYWLRW